MRRSVLVLLIGVLFWCAAGQECKFTDPETGLSYNLLPLRQGTNASESSFYSYQSAQLGQFYLNVCGAVNPSFNCPSDTAVCQKDTERAMHSDGSASGYTLSAYTNQAESGVEVVYTDGEECNNSTRTTHLYILCVPGALPVVFDAQQDNTTECVYNIWMNSKYGCPSNETEISSSASPSISPSPSMSPSNVSPSPSASMSSSSSATPSVTTTPTPSLTTGSSPSASASFSASVSPSASASVSASASTSANTAEPSASVSVSMSASQSSLVDEEPPETPEEPGTWAWYFMIGVVVLVLCLTALIAVAVILQKKRQDEVEFDPLDFE